MMMDDDDDDDYDDDDDDEDDDDDDADDFFYALSVTSAISSEAPLVHLGTFICTNTGASAQ